MGLFSWECPSCGNSIRHRGACKPESRWMSQAVYLGANGNIVRGEYDGYGRISEIESLGEQEGMFALYHQACHKVVGEPKYTAPSRNARDQGHFVGEYDPAEPKAMVDLIALMAHAEIERAKERRFAEFMKKERALLSEIGCSCGRQAGGLFVVTVGDAIWIRCADRKCNKLQSLPEPMQAVLRSLYAEYGEEPFNDDEVNADYATLNQAKREIARLQEEIKERDAIPKDQRDPEMDEYYAELMSEAEEVLVAERKRLGL